MRVRYALKNLLKARMRLAIAIAGIAFASFLMAVQGSLLYGFTLAASRVVDAVGGDVWMVSPGIPAFDFVSPIEERNAWLAMGLRGVASTGRGLAGWAPFEKVDGDWTYVFVIGVDREIAGATPDAQLSAATLRGREIPVAVDETDLARLGGAVPARVEIGGRRADLAVQTTGFASFMGTPFVFADIVDVRRFLPYDDEDVSFVTVNVAPGFDVLEVKEALQERFPHLGIWTKNEFSWRCRIFWLIQTGAGGALSLAAILGFLIGLSVVAQTIYSMTTEGLEEYATLKAMGASSDYVRSIVLIQSLACGSVGSVAGLAAVAPFTQAAKVMVTWIAVPPWMYAVALACVATLCTLAALIASRPAMSAEPARVFRA